MKKIAIIGTGISALTCGWFLKEKYKNTLEIIFIEKKNRTGGLIQTLHKDDFLFELGPRGFRPSGSGKTTLELSKALGLESELISANAKAKNRYICQKGALSKFSLLFLLKSGMLSGGIKDLFTKTTVLEDETIGNFFRRRFNQKLLNKVMDPLVKGVFGGDPEALSMKSSFPFFWNLEKKYGSVLKGFFSKRKEEKPKSSLFSFQSGMQTLTDELTKKLEAHFLLNTFVLKIVKKEKEILVELSNGHHLAVDFVILAIPDYEIEQLIRVPKIVQNRESLVTVNLGWKGKKLTPSGYGFLVPTFEKKELLGMTFDSEIFPEQNRGEMTRVTAMVHQTHKEDYLSLVLSEIKALLNISDPPDTYHVHIYQNTIPQYTLGHHERLMKFKDAFPKNMLFLGNSFYGVSVNDCIEKARSSVEKLEL